MNRYNGKISIVLFVVIVFAVLVLSGCTKEEIKTQSVVADIPYETVEELDNTLAAGERRVITEGESGFKRVTFEFIVVNGEETSKKIVKERVIKKPVSEVVAVGPVK